MNDQKKSHAYPEPTRKLFICEICQQAAINPLTIGIESDRKFSSLIQLCPECGAVGLELMQFCREAAMRPLSRFNVQSSMCPHVLHLLKDEG